MQTRTLSRELALLVLGQCAEQKRSSASEDSLDVLLQKALDSLMQHWREVLDHCAVDLEKAQQSLLDSELRDGNEPTDAVAVRSHLRDTLTGAEQVLNGLSASLELPRLLALADQDLVRQEAMRRATAAHSRCTRKAHPRRWGYTPAHTHRRRLRTFVRCYFRRTSTSTASGWRVTG